MALPIGVIALLSGLGAFGLFAVARKPSATAVPPGTPDLPPVVPPPATTTPSVYTPPPTTPAAPAPAASSTTGLTPAGVLFDTFGRQATIALKALGYDESGRFTPGVATAEAVQAATSLAALMEANGFSAQAAQLRDYAKTAAASIRVDPCPGVPSILPEAVGTAVCRALNLERDPKVLRGLAQALRGLPQSSDPKVVSLIKMIETTAATLEAQQSEADTIAKIQEVLTAKTPGVMPAPIPEDKYSPPVLSAEIQALVDAALRGMGVSGGVVKGPVTPDALVAARQAISALESAGHSELAGQMRYYLMYAEKMIGSTTPATPALTPKPATYTVKSGDTGSAIAKTFTGDGNRWRELKAANPAIAARPDPKNVGLVLYPGDVLTLPSNWPASPGTSAAVVLATSTPTAATPTKPTTYTVKSGDTGSAIAKAFTGDGNRWRELKAANPTIAARPDPKNVGLVLRIGDVLTLPASW